MDSVHNAGHVYWHETLSETFRLKGEMVFEIAEIK
jgi:hypothetical protein